MAPFLNSLTSSTNRCSIDVRILSLWQSIKDEVSTGPVGLNMKLLDENGTSIEAYINPRIVGRFHPLLHQSEMYSLFNFSVVLFSHDITHRVSKNSYYILFHEHPEVKALGPNDKAIPKYCFDFVFLKDVRHIKHDNNILIDIVGLIGCVELPSIVINNEGVEEKFVEFGITDGMLCRVVCRMTVKNIDEHEEWYICICSECGLEFEENAGSNKCPHCKVKIVMADKRYRLIAQAFDKSAELYILLGDNAVEKLLGKTVFEIQLAATMAIEKYDSLTSTDPDNYNWKVKVRISRKWESIQKNTTNVKGWNIILVDDQEGEIYVIQNFSVKPYTEKEKHMCFKDDTHIYFSSYTQEFKYPGSDNLIPANVFGFYDISELLPIVNQNTFLIDVVGVVQNVEFPRHFVNKNNEEQSYVKFDLTDGSFKQSGFRTTQMEMARFEPDPNMSVAEIKSLIPETEEGGLTQTSKHLGKSTPDTLKSTNRTKGKKKLLKNVRKVNLAADADEDEEIPLGMWTTQTDPE
ncbi:hypothetical protein DCAR_0623439 [Daucus carota subsp. sativus]|uniref:Replication protein A 70 kDa DNA-binding subunit B/D first OB fold domain-containing protein n=1 Tax=Daucus carota subsp. sativus TaxID=79200 RepID=A0A175YDV5_DAUCS|nr:hypothetical protein DCAR_0623439 [Daucus carota subsp. sativus]